MNAQQVAVLLLGIFTGLSAYFLFLQNRRSSRDRLESLLKADQEEGDSESEKWSNDEAGISRLGDRLGRAGFLSIRERHFANLLKLTMLVSGLVLGIVLFARGSILGLLVGVLCGLYFGFMLWFYYLHRRTRDQEREVLFQLPLVLEELILLVESGMGVLPAIHEIVSVKDERGGSNPVVRILRLVYKLSASGVPIRQALEMIAEAVDTKVLRHVLLHLDISSNEGGELIPSLKSLSDHAHSEWKLSVETRVKRLENLVVFPVFLSVIGLLFLCAAVPMVPVMEFFDSIDAGKTQAVTQINDKPQLKVFGDR